MYACYVLYVCNHSCEDICTSISTYISYICTPRVHARHVSFNSWMHTGIYLYTGMCVHFHMNEFKLMGMHSCMRRQVCIKTGKHVCMRVIAHRCNRQCILKCTHFCLQKYRTIFHRTIFLLLLDHLNLTVRVACPWRKLWDSGAIMTYNTRLLMCNAVKQKRNT